MSEQKDTILSELEEATTVSEPTSEDAATQASSAESEPSTAALENIVSTPKAPSIDYAKAQEEAWAQKIASDTTGEELKSFEDNKSLGWLHDRVKTRLGITQPVKQEVPNFQKQMAEYKAQEEQSTLMEKAKSLPIDQRKEVTNKVRDAVEGLGADPVKALRKALSEIKEGSTPAPIATSGRVSNASGSITLEQLSQMPQAEYNATYKRIDAGELQLLS
jgi:hypothetical protein